MISKRGKGAKIVINREKQRRIVTPGGNRERVLKNESPRDSKKVGKYFSGTGGNGDGAFQHFEV